MGTDVPDWQQQITVNTDVVTPASIDITTQTIGNVSVLPEPIIAAYKKMSTTQSGVSVASGQTKSLHIVNTSGWGANIFINVNTPKMSVRCWVDDVLGMSMAPESLHDNFNDIYEVHFKRFEITTWDTVNNLYIMRVQQTFQFRFQSKLEFKVFNGDGATKIINRITMLWHEDR